MAIEIVSFPMKHGDFPYLCKRLPEGKTMVDSEVVYQIDGYETLVFNNHWLIHGY